MTEKQRVLDAIVEAEATADDTLPASTRGRRANKSVSVAVRLSADVAQEVEDLASRLGVPTSELVRGWIGQGLAAHRETSVEAALDRLEADLSQLRSIVA